VRPPFNPSTQRSDQAGFSLIELTISLLVVGVLTGVTAASYSGVTGGKTEEVLVANLGEISLSIANFALLNHRIPCVDTDSDGYENCEQPNAKVGGLPYLSISIDESPGELSESQLVYGVYRQLDLTAHVERTGNVMGEQGFLDRNDFRQALISAANEAFSVTHLHVTGDNALTGTEDCSANRSQNIAYILIDAGLRDRNNNGSKFDGENASFGQTGVPCFSAPSRQSGVEYDDKVIAIGFESLLGRMSLARR
jgi:prepilin-type N-terminal cleavage/methylation domain-containing protein